MAETRLATVEDAQLLAEHRRKMFADATLADEATMGEMVERFVPWVRERIAKGTYVGWLIEEDGSVVAGAGLWVMDWPPHYMDAEPHRAYLLNFYVAPEMRGRGMARELLALAVGEAKARGIKVVVLHASKFGKPIYEKNGFAMSNEMMLRFAE